MKSSKYFLSNLSIITFMLTLVTGCYYDNIIPVVPEEPIGDVSYSLDMQPYFDASCVQCHNGTGVPLNLAPNVSYNELISGGYIDTSEPSSSLLYTKTASGGSMEQYSTSSEAAMTLKWIEQGALDN